MKATLKRIECSKKKARQCVLALALILLSNFGLAQSSVKGSAEGTLNVSAVVMASATVVIEPDGTQVLVVANAPDARDNVSQLMPAENPTSKHDQKSTQKTGHEK
jgi:hypothetical protein